MALPNLVARFVNFSGSRQASYCSAKLLSIFYHIFVSIFRLDDIPRKDRIPRNHHQTTSAHPDDGTGRRRSPFDGTGNRPADRPSTSKNSTNAGAAKSTGSPMPPVAFTRKTRLFAAPVETTTSPEYEAITRSSEHSPSIQVYPFSGWCGRNSPCKRALRCSCENLSQLRITSL